MGDTDIKASQWKLVQTGRVVLFTGGKYSGSLAAIVEIVDHKRVRRHLQHEQTFARC
jgi:large subunit ribosomal protein L14e